MQKLKSAIRRNPRLKWHYKKLYRLKKALGHVIRYGSSMGCSYLVLDEQKVVYIVMQKAACTSIKASMTGLQTDEDYLSVHEMIRRTGHVLTRLDPEAHRGYFIFTFVRNPFERLISCYENKYHTDRENRDFTKQDTRMKYDDYLLGYLSKDQGFRSFARRVCRIPDRLADNHFVSQSFIIGQSGPKLKPNFVGHFEHLEEEYEPIRQRYGFIPLPHYNPTPKAVSWMDYYDLPTARKVYRRYRQDIERFGYRDTYDALIRYLSSKEPKS